ncbi:MAG: response regulator [Gammaproteobacteria bacterium]|jgi:CheY-like chemotaxis protein|nr:response regulator [Gammaproteobacteria bacterium]
MRVLFVDDEPNILDSIRRQLRKSFDIVTATSGAEALALLKDTGPVALVVSDMRMPGMNGAELLTRIRDQYPDTVRMILSGQADLDSTISAINDGHIFRFLTKPCNEDALRAAVRAGLDQHELITTRKELLEKTLQGLVEMLTDILGITNPVARRRTGRVRQYSAAIASALKFTMPWDLRLATLLSQLGCITLPVALLDKLYAGTPLDDEELRLYRRHPEVAATLIRRIPQLGPVAAMVARQQQVTDFTTLPAEIDQWPAESTASVILAVATALDDLMATGEQPADALKRLEQSMPGLPKAIVEAVRAVHMHSAYMDICWVGLDELRPGMVLDEDIVADNGDTLMFRGEEITGPLLTQLRETTVVPSAGEPVSVSQKLRVLMPA